MADNFTISSFVIQIRVFKTKEHLNIIEEPGCASDVISDASSDS